MTESSAKSKARKATAEFETTMDNFAKSLPTFEIPAAWREAAEKGTTQARDAYARFKAAAEAGTEITEAALSTARDNAAVVGLKAIEATKTNADATFSFLKELFSAKSIAEAVELQATFARRQFDTLSAQAKEFGDLTQKVMVETSKPGREAFEKMFKEAGIA
jgi:phasin